MTALWEAATEEEREELMQAIVVRVGMDEKEEGTWEVAFLPQVPCPVSDRLGSTSQMGAGNSCGAYNYGGIAFDSQLLRAPGMRQIKEAATNQTEP